MGLQMRELFHKEYTQEYINKIQQLVKCFLSSISTTRTVQTHLCGVQCLNPANHVQQTHISARSRQHPGTHFRDYRWLTRLRHPGSGYSRQCCQNVLRQKTAVARHIPANGEQML